MTFSEFFRPGRNRLGWVRHLLAVVVLCDHAFLLHHGQGLLAGMGFATSLGAAGVAGFFVLSGALVTSSWLERGDPIQFLANRGLRIFPGYLVCLLITALVLGPLAWNWCQPPVETHGEYWSSRPGPVSYVLKNAGLMQFQNRIGELFATHHEPYSINGSLWSIPWEAACYGMVAAMGLAGMLGGGRRAVWLCFLLFLGNALLAPAGSFFSLFYSSERVTVLPAQFLAGALFYLHRDRIPMGWGWAALFLAGFIALGFWNWTLASCLCLPYVLFFAARRGRMAQKSASDGTDLSYGIYIYAFPVTQLLAGTDWVRGTAWLFTVGVFLATLPWAGLSWFLVERPALARKRETAQWLRQLAGKIRRGGGAKTG